MGRLGRPPYSVYELRGCNSQVAYLEDHEGEHMTGIDRLKLLPHSNEADRYLVAQDSEVRR